MYLNFILKVQCIFAQAGNTSDQNRAWSKYCKLGVKKGNKWMNLLCYLKPHMKSSPMYAVSIQNSQ